MATLSALGSGAFGLVAAWTAVSLRLPVPAALLVWIGCVGTLTAVGWVALRGTRRPEGRRRAAVAALALGALALVPGCLALPAISAYVANELRLTDFAGQLYRHPAPLGMRVVSTEAEVGVLTGNGDHCDYAARVLLEASRPVSRGELEEHYSGLRLRSAMPGGDDGQVWLSVEDLPGGADASARASPSLYVVQITDVHAPNADVRCW